MAKPMLTSKNRLLLALPSRELERIMPSLQTVPCHYGDVLVDAQGTLERVYFPDSGVISIIAVYPDGKTVELATIGREGCTGFQTMLGARASSVRLLVQVPGSAVCMPRRAFCDAFEHNSVVRKLLLAYLHAFMEQILISGGCNSAHGVRERLARWLLMMRDRSDSDELPITQDLVAEMLGVHRPTVTKVVRSLEKDGLIETGRKRLVILDRNRLSTVSCECYRIVRARTAFHLPNTYND